MPRPTPLLTAVAAALLFAVHNAQALVPLAVVTPHNLTANKLPGGATVDFTINATPTQDDQAIAYEITLHAHNLSADHKLILSPAFTILDPDGNLLFETTLQAHTLLADTAFTFTLAKTHLNTTRFTLTFRLEEGGDPWLSTIVYELRPAAFTPVPPAEPTPHDPAN